MTFRTIPLQKCKSHGNICKTLEAPPCELRKTEVLGLCQLSDAARCRLAALLPEAQLAWQQVFNPAWSSLPHSEILCMTTEV